MMAALRAIRPMPTNEAACTSTRAVRTATFGDGRCVAVRAALIFLRTSQL